MTETPSPPSPIILIKLDNFTHGTFIRPPQQLRTKEYVHRMFRKTNITHAYQGVRNVIFSKHFAHVLNELSLTSNIPDF